MGLQWCSIADVSLRLKATESQASGLDDGLWYGGLWMGNRTMYFEVVTGVANPGLYYWEPGNTEYFYTGYSVTKSGSGTLAKAFVGGELDCVLRFVTGVDGTAQVYLDDNLLDEYDPAGETALADLVSWLYHSGGGKSISGAGYETFRVGGGTATVWEGHIPGPTAAVKVKVADGAPEIIATAAHDWTDWVAFVDGGGNPAVYDDNLDLFADGYFYAQQVAVDADGCFYGASNAGNTFLELQQAAFRKYRPAGGVGLPNLSIAHHPVSNTLVVIDAGLALDGSVGLWKVQNR